METLQQHKLIKVIKNKLVRKTLDMIKKISDAFWKEYSTNIKLVVIKVGCGQRIPPYQPPLPPILRPPPSSPMYPSLLMPPQVARTTPLLADSTLQFLDNVFPGLLHPKHAIRLAVA